jgi:hypothetical protein
MAVCLSGPARAEAWEGAGRAGGSRGGESERRLGRDAGRLIEDNAA